MMKVRELIASLSQYDPDELVAVLDCDKSTVTNVAFVNERVTMKNLNGGWGYDGTRYVEIASGGMV